MIRGARVKIDSATALSYNTNNPFMSRITRTTKFQCRCSTIGNLSKAPRKRAKSSIAKVWLNKRLVSARSSLLHSLDIDMNPAPLYRVRDIVNVAMKVLVALCRRELHIHLAGCWDCSLCQFCKSKSVCAYEFTVHWHDDPKVPGIACLRVLRTFVCTVRSTVPQIKVGPSAVAGRITSFILLTRNGVWVAGVRIEKIITLYGGSTKSSCWPPRQNLCGEALSFS